MKFSGTTAVEAEGFRGLEVDDEIEFGRGLHRQICRLLAMSGRSGDSNCAARFRLC
jgi:hypothetical protein